MRKLYLFAAMAAMLAACSSDDLTVEKQVAQQNAEEGAVVFDVYTQRTTTRAGEVGSLTTDGLKTGNFKEEGFGVFGYYTNSSTYDQQAIPNFFYNQQVKWESTGSGSFKYEPLKYWPNEYGNTANSDDADKVTYFAYAPWVSVNPNTGKPDGETDPDKLSDLQKWGINSMTTNSTAGDPLIKYIASFDQAKSVDLCWGVCDETNWQKIQDGKAQTFTAGMPWENVERPANTNQRLKFTFKHATAQLKVNIDAFVDGITNATSIDSKTKVYVRAITFEGLATKGSLNLNNKEAKPNKAYWMDYNGVNDLPMGETVTVYDGRKDGKEGTLSGEATNEKSLGLNPNLVQSTLWNDASAKPGVTNVSQPLFRNGDVPATEPIYVIPTGDPVKVTITYDIETADKNLSTYVSDAEQHGSSIENVIWKNITFGKDAEGKDINTFENGKSYTLNLHLGMNSVKFDAAVTDWVAQAANDVDLPANIPSYEAGDGSKTEATELAYDLTSYQFAITGLEPYETVNATNIVAPVKTAAAVTANASGIAIVTVTLDANTTVNNKTTASPVVFTGSKSSKVVKLNVTQKAAPLGFSVSSVDFANKTIHLASSTVNWNSTDIADATKDVTVLKNGIKLTTITSGVLTDNTQAKFQTSGSILLSAIEEGDVYSIMIKAGDAAPETFTVTMGYIRFAKETLGLIVNQKGSVTLNHFGDGEVTYTAGSSVASVDSKGIVTAGAANGGCTISATVVDTKHTFYKTKTASYVVVVGDVVIGNNFAPAVVAKEGSTSESVIISGLTPSESVTVETTDGAMITDLAGSTDSSGRCTVTYKVAAYTSGSEDRVAKITVKGATSGTTEITVNQTHP